MERGCRVKENRDGMNYQKTPEFFSACFYAGKDGAEEYGILPGFVRAFFAI